MYSSRASRRNLHRPPILKPGSSPLFASRFTVCPFSFKSFATSSASRISSVMSNTRASFPYLFANRIIGKHVSANDLEDDQKVLTDIMLSSILMDLKGKRAFEFVSCCVQLLRQALRATSSEAEGREDGAGVERQGRAEDHARSRGRTCGSLSKKEEGKESDTSEAEDRGASDHEHASKTSSTQKQAEEISIRAAPCHACNNPYPAQ